MILQISPRMSHLCPGRSHWFSLLSAGSYSQVQGLVCTSLSPVMGLGLTRDECVPSACINACLSDEDGEGRLPGERVLSDPPYPVPEVLWTLSDLGFSRDRC